MVMALWLLLATRCLALRSAPWPYIRTTVAAASARAARLIAILDRLLPSYSTGRMAPDERDTLLRFCVWPRLRHLLRTLPPGTADDIFSAFDDTIAAARLAVVPSAAFLDRLSCPH